MGIETTGPNLCSEPLGGGPNLSQTTEYTAGVEAARRRICVWLRAQANAEYKLRPDGAARSAFVEAHNVILKIDLPEGAESHD